MGLEIGEKAWRRAGSEAAIEKGRVGRPSKVSNSELIAEVAGYFNLVASTRDNSKGLD